MYSLSASLPPKLRQTADLLGEVIGGLSLVSSAADAHAERAVNCFPRLAGALYPYAGRSRCEIKPLAAGEASNDGGEGVHVGLMDNVIGDAPTIAVRPEVFHHLVDGSD